MPVGFADGTADGGRLDELRPRTDNSNYFFHSDQTIMT